MGLERLYVFSSVNVFCDLHLEAPRESSGESEVPLARRELEGLRRLVPAGESVRGDREKLWCFAVVRAGLQPGSVGLVRRSPGAEDT